jgi:endonuclease VIII
MPEGHTIHRLARDLKRDLAGSAVHASSPQGRFEEGAAHLDGRTLTGTEAYGKHLFLRWDGGGAGTLSSTDGELLYVHLGLIGKFRRRPAPVPEPVGQVRLRLETDAVAWDLSGPMACAIDSPAMRARVLEKAGPDPLRRDADPDRFVHALARRAAPIAGALLDQGAISGVGNVYRAEICFLCGIHPLTPAKSLAPEQAKALWAMSADLLSIGLRLNRIVTRDPAEIGMRAYGRVPNSERLYVYKRGGEPCRRCHTPIVWADVGGRRVWWCPRCQPEHAA